MNERIKRIRKAVGLTQSEFGERIGVKGNTVTNYETGLRTPSDAVILSICREFNVNEPWLRTGKGEMLLQLDKDEEFDRLCAEIQMSDDEFIKDIMRKYWRLDEHGKAIIRNMLSGM